jgi:hypothetical protein
MDLILICAKHCLYFAAINASFTPAVYTIINALISFIVVLW